MTTIAVTGHRDAHGYDEDRFERLTDFAEERLATIAPARVITGVAIGWDMAVAGACQRLQIPFIAAVPFHGQSLHWSLNDRLRYDGILMAAESVAVVSKYSGYHAFQLRNEYMVDRAEHLVALWSGKTGGTRNCVLYAEKKGVPVTNLWDAWEAFIS